MADLLQIGISGLRASQAALTVTGHNITNANTEGYSRQEINLSTNSSHLQSGNWVGTGVNIDSVTRVYDKFLTGQLWRDSSSFNRFAAMANNAAQVDSLLADPGTGIQPGLEKMFGSLQSVVDNPSSLAARSVLLSESEGLADRFHLIDERLSAQTEIVQGQMKVMAEEITEIAKAIAELNKEIQHASALSQKNMPNDLLDRRDLLVKKLSEKVAVNVVEQDDNMWNITIGKGQVLVVGKEHNKLFTASGSTDASRMELYIQTDRKVQRVSESITGGELGGTLEFRSTVLDPTRNELGRLALVINQSFNEQHKQGLDFDGRKGIDFFTSVNAADKVYQRVIGDNGNSRSSDRLIGVYIKDSSVMTASDYKVEFPGPNDYSFRITRVSDGEVLKTSSLDGVWPNSIEVDGFEIRFEDGSFKAGDKFLITPTRNGAAELQMNLTRAEQVAVASPVVAGAEIGNTGNGSITQPNVFDSNTPFFSKEGELNPPLKIVFTSPNTYDVLDNTDPGNPIPLFPPLMNQKYVPGISNSIFPQDTGRTAFTSFGGILPSNPTYQAPAPAGVVNSNNNFAGERLLINYTNPKTGQVTSQPLLETKANASAKEIAKALSQRPGVQASARTTLELSNFSPDANSFLPMDVSINGVTLTDAMGPNQSKYAPGYPEEVPDPITPNFLADRINANYQFRDMGIVARSDGERVTIIALDGEDLELEFSGDMGASVNIGNGQDIILRETANATYVPLNEFDGYDFSENGPYTYEFDIPGQGTFNIQLKDNYASGTDVINGIRTQLQNAGFAASGELDISISERGTISFKESMSVNGRGMSGSNKATMGGQLKVITEAGYSLGIAPPGNNLFPTEPVGEPIHFGFEVKIDGVVQKGDSFTLDYNQDGTSDSRNGGMLAALQSKNTLNKNANYTDTYGMMVERVGSITNRAQVNRESSEILLNHSQNTVASLSGVNLDEEAASLIQFELAYNANAQIIQVARSIFDTLIATFR